MRIKYLIFLFFIASIMNAQNEMDSIQKSYDFVIYDGANSFSMHQFDQNYLSTYRILSRSLDHISSNKHLNSGIKLLFVAFIGMPLTHEEGHRSVLTHKNIGSISQPFFNSKGAAFVKGVTDETLLNLRNTDLPTYIRMHTAGLESDNMLTFEMENLLVFEEDSYNILKEEYVLRKLSTIGYHLYTFLPEMMPDIKESKNELENDIVGHDIWGMIRHLHRPEMEFYRYTQFKDLTNEETKYAKKLAWRSFTNLFTPLIIGKINFNLSDNLKGNFALGHSLSPFGDYFEQNIWLMFKNKYKTSFYFREFMNRESTFFGGGIKLRNYEITNKIKTSIGFDIWKQPEDFSFNTNKGELGINSSIKLNYRLFNNSITFIKKIGLFTDLSYKTKGFLPEYASLDEDFNIRFGLQFCY